MSGKLKIGLHKIVTNNSFDSRSLLISFGRFIALFAFEFDVEQRRSVARAALVSSASPFVVAVEEAVASSGV